MLTLSSWGLPDECDNFHSDNILEWEVTRQPLLTTSGIYIRQAPRQLAATGVYNLRDAFHSLLITVDIIIVSYNPKSLGPESS